MNAAWNAAGRSPRRDEDGRENLGESAMRAVGRIIRIAVWMLVSAAVLTRGAHAQASPDSSGVPKPDSAAVAKPDTAAAHTPAPAAAPAVATPPATPPPAATTPPATTSATVSASSSAPLQAAGMFSKGNKRVTGTLGWGHSFNTDYLLLGIGAGYYLANGLDVGVDFEGWLIGDPSIYKLSPRADYVLWKMKRIKPYAGAFYRWNFVGNGYDDKNSLGGRAGAFYQSRGGRSMAGAGVVYERYLNLDERFGSSDVVYPEVFVTVSF
jgi:hypothetical protein